MYRHCRCPPRQIRITRSRHSQRCLTAGNRQSVDLSIDTRIHHEHRARVVATHGHLIGTQTVDRGFARRVFQLERCSPRQGDRSRRREVRRKDARVKCDRLISTGVVDGIDRIPQRHCGGAKVGDRHATVIVLSPAGAVDHDAGGEDAGFQRLHDRRHSARKAACAEPPRGTSAPPGEPTTSREQVLHPIPAARKEHVGPLSFVLKSQLPRLMLCKLPIRRVGQQVFPKVIRK